MPSLGRCRTLRKRGVLTCLDASADVDGFRVPAFVLRIAAIISTSIRSGSDKFRARQPGRRRYGALSEESLDARNGNVPKRSLQEKLAA